jgi:hypothetical protein
MIDSVCSANEEDRVYPVDINLNIFTSFECDVKLRYMERLSENLFWQTEASLNIRGYILRPFKEGSDSVPGGHFNNEPAVVGNERAPIAIEDDVG